MPEIQLPYSHRRTVADGKTVDEAHRSKPQIEVAF